MVHLWTGDNMYGWTAPRLIEEGVDDGRVRHARANKRPSLYNRKEAPEVIKKSSPRLKKEGKEGEREFRS